MPTKDGRAARERRIKARIRRLQWRIVQLRELLQAERRSRLGPEDKQAIADDYLRRVKVKTIAAQHSRALSTVNDVIAELGVPRRYNKRKNHDT